MSYCVNITFTAATPAPVDGYRVRYRVLGSNSSFNIVTGLTSPILICGLNDNTTYEALIDSDCGDVFCIPVPLTISPPATTTSTTTTSTTSTTTTAIVFDTILTFVTSTQDSKEGVTGTVASTSAVTKFEFNKVIPRVGTPLTMLINFSGSLYMVIDYYSDYNGRLFRFTHHSGAIFYGNFTNGTVNF